MELLPEIIRKHIPAPEPRPPSGGFTLRVSNPYISSKSKDRVMEAIENATISSGSSVVAGFEDKLKQFYSVPFAKACSSGFSALVLSLRLASVGPGDDVIIPSFTFVAVANSVLMVGANPIFVDCADGQLNPSPSQYEEKVTPSTKAIIVTHTFGVPADCSALRKLCNSKGLIFIEDIAEAIGTEYNGKMVGTFGDFACSSLYANKIITSGDGGFVISKNEQDASRAHSYTNHGSLTDIRFFHLECCGNYKMSGLQAAFATPAVEEIPMVIEDRRRICTSYRNLLGSVSDLMLLPINSFGQDAPWLFGVLVKSKHHRTFIRNELAKQGIETRDFFFPLHLQPAIVEKVGLRDDSLMNSVFLGTHGFCLPTYYGLKEEDIEFICNCLKKAIPTETE